MPSTTALPTEDFAADVIYDLEQLRDDEAAIDESTAARLTAIINRPAAHAGRAVASAQTQPAPRCA